MQAVISTDNFILSVMDTIVSQTNLWKEQEYINQLKAALYINLLGKTIISDGEEKELPSEWVDDTPRVIDMWLCCLRVENRTEATINSYRGEIKNLFCYIQKHYADITTNDIRAYLSWHQHSDKQKLPGAAEEGMEKSTREILEAVCEDICNNYCKYRDTEDEECLCSRIREGDSCPLDRLN